MNDVWVRVDLVNGESYIGSINSLYNEEDEEEFLLFLEEQSYMGLKLENVQRCVEKGSSLEVFPLDTKDSLYKSSMLIMNIDNILTVKFLKEDSDIVRKLRAKIKKSDVNIKNAKNVLNFRLTKKEYI